MQYAGIAALMTAAVIVAPTLVARFLVGGDWRHVATAHGVWLVLLLLVLGGGSSRWIEKFNWMMLAATILTIVAVPVLTLILRLGSSLAGRAN